MTRLIYIATGNPSKLKDFQTFFAWIDPGIAVQLVPNYVNVEETGTTLEENSKLKVTPYVGKCLHPVIANDSGVFFESRVIENLDPTMVKRNALGKKIESELSQEKIGKLMFDYYRSLARKYGGEIQTEMRDVFTILEPGGTIKQAKAVREYTLVDRETSHYDIYHPLNSLRVSVLTGKFMDEMTTQETKIDRQPILEALKALVTITPLS